MGRLKRSYSRAVTISTCNQSVASLAESVCSVHKPHRKQKSSKKMAKRLNNRLRLFSFQSNSRISEYLTEKIELLESKSKGRVEFPVFEDLKVFTAGGAIKKRVVAVSKDFDCSSDDELIKKEIQNQQAKVARQISKLKK